MATAKFESSLFFECAVHYFLSLSLQMLPVFIKLMAIELDLRYFSFHLKMLEQYSSLVNYSLFHSLPCKLNYRNKLR